MYRLARPPLPSFLPSLNLQLQSFLVEEILYYLELLMHCALENVFKINFLLYLELLKKVEMVEI